ncbi:MAG: class I SAM-dependent methyltransferase [Fibrobacter sp.]|nr:class I SAM-dependent methyltransferase [Fibrobacter sp.]
MPDTIQEQRTIFNQRLDNTPTYRDRVWTELIKYYFYKWVPADADALVLGCDCGDFINNIKARNKFVLNLRSLQFFYYGDVNFINQDYSLEWKLNEKSLDVIFCSNLDQLSQGENDFSEILQQAYRCLKPGGVLIVLGYNVRYSPDAYWRIFKDEIVYNDRLLAKTLKNAGFTIEKRVSRFLSYYSYPVSSLKSYIEMPFLWWFKGREFLIVAVRSRRDL